MSRRTKNNRRRNDDSNSNNKRDMFLSPVLVKGCLFINSGGLRSPTTGLFSYSQRDKETRQTSLTEEEEEEEEEESASTSEDNDDEDEDDGEEEEIRLEESYANAKVFSILNAANYFDDSVENGNSSSNDEDEDEDEQRQLAKLPPPPRRRRKRKHEEEEEIMRNYDQQGEIRRNFSAHEAAALVHMRGNSSRENAASFRVIVLTKDGKTTDGQKWRKYGQKFVKGSKYPRSYYKCTTIEAMNIQKHVEEMDGGGILVTFHSPQENIARALGKKISGSVVLMPGEGFV